MKKLTAKEFIERAKKIHGNKYDYSKVEYINNNTKVCIICPIHGEFWQTPGNHLSGKGCIKCKTDAFANSRRKTNEAFINDAIKIHGNKYDYSKVKYTSKKKPITIICPIHGEFNQKPEVHLMGCGCQKCCKNGVKLTTEEFIKRAKKIHGDKYDYSKVNYINSKTKVCIISKEHGEFWQLPCVHLSSSGYIKEKTTTKSFIEKAKKVHGDKYDYSKVEYLNGHTKVCIICPKHGEFWQKPDKHLQSHGCPTCRQSKLESKVEKILNKYEIEYEREKKFEWLKHKSYLRLDFYIPKYNMAIECQGKQHFLEGCFTNGETLDEIQKRDYIKQSLCEENGIKLIYFGGTQFSDKKSIITKEIDLIKEIIH